MVGVFLNSYEGFCRTGKEQSTYRLTNLNVDLASPKNYKYRVKGLVSLRNGS